VSRARAGVEAVGRELGEAWGINQIKEKPAKRSRNKENRGQEREALSRVEHQVHFRLHSDLPSFVCPGFPAMYYTIIRDIEHVIREYALRFSNK
jgi:hypothetical protein